MAALQPTEDAPKGRKRGKWRKLETIQDVRLAMARVIKDVYDSEIDTMRGAVCLSGLRALGAVIRDTALEERLKLVEEKIQQAAQ
jgi:hypothetical protein